MEQAVPPSDLLREQVDRVGSWRRESRLLLANLGHVFRVIGDLLGRVRRRMVTTALCR
jgi:hypothetical protein